MPSSAKKPLFRAIMNGVLELLRLEYEIRTLVNCAVMPSPAIKRILTRANVITRTSAQLLQRLIIDRSNIRQTCPERTPWIFSRRRQARVRPPTHQPPSWSSCRDRPDQPPRKDVLRPDPNR